MSILFATPMYGGFAHERHIASCLRLREELLRAGITHDWLTGRNESMVHRARMEMCATFLRKTDYDRLMWLDSDIEFEPEDVAKLWNLDVDVAVAFYAMKRPDMPLSAWLNGKLVKLDECPKEPFAVDYAGTGFMLIKRSAIERVIELLKKKEQVAQRISGLSLFPDDWDDFHEAVLKEMCDAMSASYQGPNGRVPTLFTAHTFNDGLESEDYSFCRKVREAGMQIVGDPSIKLKHWGQAAYA